MAAALANRGHMLKAVLAITAIFLVQYLFRAPSLSTYSPPLAASISASRSSFSMSKTLTLADIPSSQKNAFCVFLAPPSHPPGPVGDINSEDHYLIGTRMLIYQMLHDPRTRARAAIPFIVLVHPDIDQASRSILQRDGAIVVEAAPITFDWIVPGRDRWAHVMDKLHVFELVQFDKVLLMDGDINVFGSLEGVFADPATEPRNNKGSKEHTMDDEADQPSVYVMAGNSGPATKEHPYPAERGDRLNAGFVVLKPSIDVFNYYMSVGAIESRFPGGSPEQDLWNYAHRRDGNMPWTQIDPDWNINTPNVNDVKQGIASVHEKYWRCRDRQLKELLLISRWKMEAVMDYLAALR